MRELFKTIYQDRPVLRDALLTILDDLSDIWGNQGTYTETAERLDHEVLPLLLSLTDLPDDVPSPREASVTHVVLEWRRIADSLSHP